MHRQVSRLAVLTLIALAAGGCAVGAIAYQALGPGEVPAKWVPPKEPTLVLVENNRAGQGVEADCDRLGRFISEDLKSHDVAPIVDVEPLIEMREHNPAMYQSMSIAGLGRAVGAKQIIYVSVQEYDSDLAMGNDQPKWTADVTVRVVDAQTGASRWPQDLTNGLPVKAETEYKAKNQQATEMALQDTLNANLADKIGKLFHKYQPDSETAEDYQQ